MMHTVVFETYIENCTIHVPDVLQKSCQGSAKVILLFDSLPQKQESIGFVQHLLQNPISIHDFEPLSKHEIYNDDV